MESLRLASRYISVPQAISSGMSNPIVRLAIVKLVACVAIALFALISLGVYVYRLDKLSSRLDAQFLKDRESLLNQIRTGDNETIGQTLSEIEGNYGKTGRLNMLNGRTRQGVASNNGSLLYQAMKWDKYEIATLLIENGAELDDILEELLALKHETQGITKEKVRFLVEQHDLDVNERILFTILNHYERVETLVLKKNLLDVILYMIQEDLPVLFHVPDRPFSLLMHFSKFWNDDPELVKQILVSMCKRGVTLCDNDKKFYYEGLNNNPATKDMLRQAWTLCEVDFSRPVNSQND